jgi:hypothetical protein|tara:strand:- start:1303 stop:1806 length:504 start_codon:yes stop_codon:yes gene_type:complete
MWALLALWWWSHQKTDAIVQAWCKGHRKASPRIHIYPFQSQPNGPGHGDQIRGSIFERAYFYNWCLAKTTCSHVVKWDGDMVALDDAGQLLKEAMAQSDVVRFRGQDIVGPVEDGLHIGARKWCPFDPRLYRVTADTYYQTGSHSEQFSLHQLEFVKTVCCHALSRA